MRARSALLGVVSPSSNYMRNARQAEGRRPVPARGSTPSSTIKQGSPGAQVRRGDVLAKLEQDRATIARLALTLRGHPMKWQPLDAPSDPRELRLVRFWDGSGIVEVRQRGTELAGLTGHSMLARKQLRGEGLELLVARLLVEDGA